MFVPHSRGPISELVAGLLRLNPDDVAATPVSVPDCAAVPPVADEDLQIALWMCYELSYQGFDGVDDDWEWHPSLVGARRELERRWLAGLRDLVTQAEVQPRFVPQELGRLAQQDDGPPLAKFLQRRATREQFREFVIHRSVYHLKEADPHSWAIPRLSGPVKAALIEIQADEYGQGRPERMHSELFRATMRALDLSDAYGHYVGRVPAQTLAVSNMMSFFGLNRRWVGAAIGQLAIFEMTSSLPNRRYGNGLRRLGGDQAATLFYDEHVEADAVHEQIASYDLCGAFAVRYPDRAADVVFGAACGLAVEAEFARYLLDGWASDASTLLQENAAA
ncbi:iron-containing redox enzyme family protein [Pseudonocardiaceae bacterium YIM PH 21723]|nr:iron-containing redox enzyme family protein [Pseudonocardiaceae bacterium YIM PH 21723]